MLCNVDGSELTMECGKEGTSLVSSGILEESGDSAPFSARNGSTRMTDQSTGSSDSMWNGGSFLGYQMGFYDFTTDMNTCGIYIQPDNRWVKLSQMLFADSPSMKLLEQKYLARVKAVASETPEHRYAQKLSYLVESEETEAYSSQLDFEEVDKANRIYSTPGNNGGKKKKSNSGRKPVPFRFALAALIVQEVLGVDDRETGKLISESPPIQYFCGFRTFSPDHHIPHSTLSELKKVFNLEFMNQINEAFLKTKLEVFCVHANQEGQVESKRQEAKVNIRSCYTVGELYLDATCTPGNVKFPMDYDIVNDARKYTEKVLEEICEATHSAKPRTYKKVLQKEIKDLSKKKKRTDDDIRNVIHHGLTAIERNFGFIDKLCKKTNHLLLPTQAYKLTVAKTIYGQQKYMYENHTNRVPHRIVSISMNFLRPIVRGKTVNNTEFGPKSEISLDEYGHVRVENFEFETFNEGTRLIDAVNRYLSRTGHYPEVIYADQIYRTRTNLQFCKDHGIRLSGPKLGRKTTNLEKLKALVEQERKDMVDRIEIERNIAREKHCWGLERIMERTPSRMEHAVSMGAFLNNLIPVGF